MREVFIGEIKVAVKMSYMNTGVPVDGYRVLYTKPYFSRTAAAGQATVIANRHGDKVVSKMVLVSTDWKPCE